VDNGAQIVIGAHPHTLQPVRRQGPALIAFSLGNFVFGAQSTDTSTTGMLELDLSADGVTGARWRAGRIEGGRPVLDDSRPRRLPLRDDLQMSTGVNLATLGPGA
jgi:poly-gamma-glutamate capsule biosynthesis protein CapA/YwtB (metallophosphatase superfamily)